MMQPTIFGGNTGLTYDQIQKQRDIANELLRANMSTPQNVGEGLSAIGRALAAKAIDKRTTRADEANRAAYDATKTDAFGSILGSLGGGSAPSYAPAAQPTAAQSVANDTMSVLGNFGGLEQQYGLPQGYLDRTYMIESGGNPNAQNPNSSAGGGFQFIDSTAKQYGLTDKTDLGASAAAAARLAADNKAMLVQALGREPTAGELYLAHQQGGAGAAKLLANPNARAVDIVGPDAVTLNGGNPNMTASDFAGKWVQKFGGAPAQPAQGQPQGQPSINPEILMKLAEIQGNDYASESDKAIASMLMGQVTQAMDPMRQMEMERARLELDALKNPQPGFTTLTDEQEAAMGLDTAGLYQQGADGKIAVIQEPKAPSAASRIVTGEDAKALGLDPALRYNVEEGPNGVKATPIGGGQTVNRTDPAPPAGFRNVYNEQGLLIAQEPIPGSPAAQEAEAAKAAQERAAAGAAVNEETRSNVVLEASGEIRKALEGGGMLDLPEVGIVGNAIKGVNQEAADVGGMLETLKGMVVFDRLEKLKQASATGASGLGQVTEREIALLGSQLGALEQNLSKERILSTLDTVEGVFGKLSPQAQAYLMGASDQMPQGGADTAAPPPAVAKNPAEMSDEELLKALGQ